MVYLLNSVGRVINKQFTWIFEESDESLVIIRKLGQEKHL